MKVIGITGGVGSGKSTVLDLLEKEFGAYVIRTDDVGRHVLDPGTLGFNEVVELFGEDLVLPSGEIDRNMLAQIVFHDKEQLVKLNRIVHPKVKQYVKEELKRIRNTEQYDLFVIESALLYEDHYELLCDETWYIYVNTDTRKKRLMDSRGYTEEKCNEIMNNQLSDGEFREKCDIIIDNNGSEQCMSDTLKKVLEV